jgi:MFS family permease
MPSSKVFEADPEKIAAATPSSATTPPPTSALSLQKVVPKSYRLDDQSQRLPFARLITVYLCLATCVFVSFLDVNSTTTSLPVIAKSLNAQNSITWAGASYLIAYAAFQVLYGRMSDIFGRKPILLGSVGMLIFGDILCGFAKNATWLYICRALSGIGGGGITSLVQIIVSDMVSLKERGKYQGMLSVAIGLGAAAGPFVSAGLLETGSRGWRWAFWVPSMLATASIPCLVFLLPTKPITGSWRDKVRKIDWLGLSSSVIAMLFILVCPPLIIASIIY